VITVAHSFQILIDMELVAVHDLNNEDKESIVDDCIKILNWEWPRSETIRKRGLLSSSENLPMNLVLIQRFSQPNEVAVLGHARIRCSKIENLWLAVCCI
jgi:hypothetical protein